MNARENKQRTDPAVRSCFRSEVRLARLDGDHDTAGLTVHVVDLPPESVDPEDLGGDTLPYLALPIDRPGAVGSEGRLALVAVEGRDRRMAEALSALLDPKVVTIGLMHVTWLPRTIASPLGERGLNNPETGELLIYRGAREALIDTADALRRAGFEVSTHLREDRDPAKPLAETIQQQRPDIFILGLGRHGAGIGRRVLEVTRIPVLFVRAR